MGEGGKHLQLHDEVARGTTVKTGPKSFVKLLFSDSSQMSLGPESTMKLEITPPGSASMVSLVGGEIRARVTKDLLHEDPAKAKDKLLIKTPKAAMGIRGTDFQVIYNPINSATSLLTFEGSVAMAKLEGATTPAVALRQANVVFVGPGQFSGLTPTVGIVSQPVKISPAQLESMKKNDSFQGQDDARKGKVASMGSPIPPGVDAKNFASAEKAFGAADAAPAVAPKGAPVEGVFNIAAGVYAPRAGGFLDMKTGLYVAPPAGSSFDANTGVFVPPKAAGGFDAASGSYVPPKGLDLDPVKGFVADVKAAPANSPSANSPSPQVGSSAANAPPPPAPNSAAAALASALNSSQQASNAGVTITFDNTISAVASSANKQGAPPPPPPALAPPPPVNTTAPPPPPPPPSTNTAGLPPPTDGPVTNPYCPTCQQQNIPNNNQPANSAVQFNINVQ